MSTDLTHLHPEAGAATGRICRVRDHGLRDFGVRMVYTDWQFDPDCVGCRLHAEHDHLHLDDLTGQQCQTPGIGGQPGKTVKCRCGGFHH